MPKLAPKQPNDDNPKNGKPLLGPPLWAVAPKDRIRCEGVQVDLASLVLDANNANLHPELSIAGIKDSLATFGQMSTITVRKADNVVMKGNGTITAARELGWTKIAASIIDMAEVESLAYGIADNRVAQLAKWDVPTLSRLERLISDAGHALPGWDIEDIALLRAEYNGTLAEPQATISLSDRFLIPPFSVLDARQGYWQERKREWIALGIKSELGRGSVDGVATPGGSPLPATTLGSDGRTIRGDGKGRPLATTYNSGAPGDLATGFKTNGLLGFNEQARSHYKTADGFKSGMQLNAEGKTMQPGRNNRTTTGACADGTEVHPQSGTSIFDPVLCEIAYRWFSPPTGIVLDPFAGGSVRGITAAKLGRRYIGIDLRPEQAAANVEQAEKICPDNMPTWLVGDSRDMKELLPNETKGVDFLFSCPPYADLERYSDDPRDLSTMEYGDFLAMYRLIIAYACSWLENDRFACFVVGDIRDRKTGNYRNFVGDTVHAFKDAGLALYNEAILVTAVGSLPIRVGRQFAGYRKLGKTHQQCLVFLKGDAGKAVEACGPVEVGDLSQFVTENADA